jgi:hypothetical protein
MSPNEPKGDYVMSFQSQLESAVQAENFKITSCRGLRSALSASGKVSYDAIAKNVGSKTMTFFQDSLVRNSFLIELVNRDITSTKFQVRWTQDLESGDPRRAGYEECLGIAEKLLTQLAELPPSDQIELGSFRTYKSVPYELPIDYRNRWAAKLHSKDNIDLVFGDTARRTIALRVMLEDEEQNPDARVFKEILSDKIKVKTYLTDRAQTGAYQTNREKRWETHPRSVQYALRLDCMEIESKLLLQVATFRGANPKLVHNLQEKGFLSAQFQYARCPITGEYLDYTAFVNDVLHPSHGRSAFQVGHLNPLKTVSEGESFGHVASNISWISDDGNRIQGSLSMAEVDDLLIRTYINRDFASKVAVYQAKKTSGL